MKKHETMFRGGTVEWFIYLTGNAKIMGSSLGLVHNVTEQGILSLLLLSTQVLIGYPVGCESQCDWKKVNSLECSPESGQCAL